MIWTNVKFVQWYLLFLGQNLINAYYIIHTGISDTVSLIFQNFENIVALVIVNLNGSYLISNFSEYVRYD